MAKIVINNTKSAIYVNKTLLIPGTNVVDSFDENDNSVKGFIGNGDLSVKDSEKMNEADKKEAVENITDRGNLEKLGKSVKGVDTKKAKEKLDKFDEQLKKGA